MEKWIPRANIRQDLWGWCDLVALSPDGTLYFIQTTSGTNHASRLAKVQAWPHLAALLRPGVKALVWSWSKRVVRNQDGSKAKRGRWTLRETDLGSGS